MKTEAYEDWKYSRAQMAMSAEWFEVNVLMEALQTVKRKHLEGAKTDFQAAHDFVFDTNKPAPYTETMRFPDDEKYVCDAIGDWKIKLTHLRALCQSAKAKATPSEDDVVQFTKLVLEMIDDLYWGASVLDRYEFEIWGFVHWGTKESK